MKVLITGGAGFLGFHLANYLNGRGMSSILCDIAPFIKEGYPSTSLFVPADVRNKSVISELTKEVDFVVHAAAALPLWPKSDIFSTNIEGTRNVLETASENGVKRVVHISSTAVYGIPKKHPIEENDPLVGAGPYGESKIEAEKLCFDFIKKGLNVTIIRPKTFLGPGRLGVFQILYDWLKEGRRIPILGNGCNRYQLLAVEDLTEAIYSLMISDAPGLNDVFNVGAKIFGTVSEDLDSLCNFAGTGSRITALPAAPVKAVLVILESLKLSPLYRWVYETADKDSYVSIEKIKDRIGWIPKFSNAQTLVSSYQWYLDNLPSLDTKSGITHRAAWKQGMLKYIKRLL